MPFLAADGVFRSRKLRRQNMSELIERTSDNLLVP